MVYYNENFTTLLSSLTQSINTGGGNPLSFYMTEACSTSGAVNFEMEENADSCDGSLYYIGHQYYVLCGEENTCYSADYEEFSNLQKPSGGVSGEVTSTPSGGNYVFAINNILFWGGNLYSAGAGHSIWSNSVSSGTTGTLILTQNYAAPQSITIYMQEPDLAESASGSASFSATMNISKIV
jgi:hypothetical protein